MSKLAAHVHAGRLVLDIPTELPEGTEIELSQADDWDALDDVVSADEVLAELDAMLV